jgi:predicted RNA-binding Zn-ribbon protein involved in translation (DUF1610 family)
MRDDIKKPLCDHCGQTLEHFLNQMEEHNLDVVCPSCGKTLISGSQKRNVEESDTDRPGPNQPPNKGGLQDSAHSNSSSQSKH